MSINHEIRPSRPRETVQARFGEGAVYEGAVGTAVGAFCDVAYPDAPVPIVAALIDGALRELSMPLQRDADIVPIDISTGDGMRIYQRSLSLLLIVAVRQLHPRAQVYVDHSVPHGGFFCQIEGRDPFSTEELAAVEARMLEIVARAEPITKETLSVPEAVRLFEAQGWEDKVRLLSFREKDTLSVYNLMGVRDYFYGYMVPNTAKLGAFSLQLHPPGFVLRMPNRHHPATLPPRSDYRQLNGVLRQYGNWLNILGVDDIASLNQVVESDRLREVVLVSEALHEKGIASIVDHVLARPDRVKLILIAGPSSSGKTTFSRRLAIQLMVQGIRPVALGLDDYFVDREKTPRDANGEFDFESLHALNLKLFNENLVGLMTGHTVRVPHYSFTKGISEPGKEIHLPGDAILIVEGIHGLNPNLVPDVPPENVYRIYVSALTQLNLDHHNRVPTTDTRLLRRMVRDARYRGYPASGTIKRWESVRRGEEQNIFPYQENADVMFNSALVYELAVLKPYAEPLLMGVPQGTLEYLEARRLLSFLQWVRPCMPDVVPDNSLLREFVGDSILREFEF